MALARPLAVVLALSSLFLAPTTGLGQKDDEQDSSICFTRAETLTALKREYGEEPIGIGITTSRYVYEILVSPRGTWTAILTFPNGCAVAVAEGSDWKSRIGRGL
jgi:hypothetical protein